MIGLGLAGLAGSARADLLLPDPDVTPPIVAIVAPMPGQEFPMGAPVMVEVEAEDPEPLSSGVAEVWLEVDGEPRLDVLDDSSPWMFSLELAPGSHEVRALARDWEGNEATSDAVTFSIAAPVGQDDSGSGEPGSTGGGAGSSSGASPGDGASSGTNAEAEPLDRGCACQSSRGRHGAPISVLLMLVLGCLRGSRRRRHEARKGRDPSSHGLSWVA